MNSTNKNIKPFYIYTEKNCLYIKNINEYTEKLSNNIYSYSANLDDKNNIHLCCLDTSGRLVHFFNNNGSWKKKVIHKFFNSLRNIKDMRLYIINDLLNVFVVESSPISENLYKISHLYFNISNYNVSRYNITNIFKDKECIYKLNIDELSNIIFEYKSKSNISRNLSDNILIFNTLGRKWITPNALIRCNPNGSSLRMPLSNIKDDIFEYCYSIKYKI
ncbi:hypothetical protein [Romboutsia sp.]|uniref:hypothetical protein n=1 Tax=Romboutsia sp. TaxID=1965302 RepID=UPI003F2D7DDA